MTTVYDVARVAGVSIATVSRVMRESTLVHPETRQRVQAVIEALVFVPDATAQGLSRRRSFAVANTGGWSSWRTVPANISSVTGTHDVYLEFSSGAGGNPPFVSLHYFNF